MGLFGFREVTGIDIGASGVKVARIAPGRRPKLVAAAIIDFPLEPGPGDAAAALARLLATRKIGRGRIATQMPGRDLTIRSFTLPQMPVAELAEAVRWEAKRHISYPLDAALIEHLVTGKKREGLTDKYEILMIAAEREKVVSQLARFRETGIAVSAVDGNALALRNVLRNRGKAARGNFLVADLGAGKTEIDIFKNGALRFSRCLETGGREVTRLMAEVLSIGLQEAEDLKLKTDVQAGDEATAAIRARFDALLMEIRRSVEYYRTTFREESVAGGLLTGGGALMRGTAKYFSEALGFPVETDDPFAGLVCADALREEFGPLAPRFSAAVGLALRKA